MDRKIAVIMGSDSDFDTMKEMIPVLKEAGIGYEFRVISAHRTPHIAADFAQHVKTNGFDLIIAGAGMSAHLPGVLAAFTGAPVIGVPIKSESSGMNGLDALLSIIQMPPGIPVAAVGIDNTTGAAKLAVKMCRTAVADNTGKPTVKIMHDRNATSGADLKKTITTLDVYGISYILIDLADFMINETASDHILPEPEEVLKRRILSGENTFAIINLTELNIEKIVENDDRANLMPIIEVPQKALSDGLNDTSDKVYSQTGRSGQAAFVGVNSYQNAAHLAARIAGIHDTAIYEAVVGEHAKLAAAVVEKDAKIRALAAIG